MVMRILFLILLSINGAIVEACTLKLRVTAFEPFMIKHEAGWSGIDIEHAQALATRINCQLRFVEAPWARGVSMLRLGKVDMMVNMSITPTRQEYLHFAGPQRLESIRLVSKVDTIGPVTSWQQLSKLDATLMRQRGSFFGKRFESMLRKNDKLRRQMLETVGNDIRIDLVEKGRVDAFVVDITYFFYLRKTNPKALNLIVHPLAINDSPVYFAFSKESISKERMIDIELAISTLIAQGTFNKIMANYL